MTQNSETQQGSAHVIAIVVLGIALVGAVGVLFYQNFIAMKPQAVANYAECVAAKDSVVQETYPETCVANDGTRFTNPAQKVASNDPKAAVKSFCAPQEKLCFDYPAEWTVTSESVSQDKDGLAERFMVVDKSGKPWLRLETGMSGVGGMCANDNGSYAKILKTHTSGVSGDYLINKGTEAYVDGAAYAVGWVEYDGATKKWSMDMELNDSKATHTVAKIDICDIGIGVLNGKNAKIDAGSASVGALAFKYYTGSDTQATYATEAEANAALSSTDAEKAYAVLQSAHYE